MVYVFKTAEGIVLADDSEAALNTDLDYESGGNTNYAQIILNGQTNWVRPYYVFLTFTPFTERDVVTSNKYLYKAEVGIGEGRTAHVEFNENTKADVTIAFQGLTSLTADTTVDVDYPISFSFGDYKGSYSSGTYIATITLGIEPL